MSVRTRFAPSPTGFMHVGGLRTALFAWLVAKQKNGQFILRIEDTDKVREVGGSDEHIKKSLLWLGLEWDEGPDKNGQSGPYHQSQRLDIYKKWAEQLVSSGRAYQDPYSPEELEELRSRAIQEKRPFLFREHRPKDAINSSDWYGNKPLRFKSEPKSYAWHDMVMGELKTRPEVVDDFIIMKSDGYPTYNFAHVIDDHLMNVSHVIRSQEFLPSVPKFLNLCEALKIKTPQLATLPYVLGEGGKKKLSKRDGAKDILDYKREGYLPEAMMNFLATLGWNDGSVQEIFSKNELLAKFDLSKVQKGGARFDEQRLIWLNGAHIRKLPIEDLLKRSDKYWPSEAKDYDQGYKKRVLGLVQDRLKYLDELPTLTKFFFVDLAQDPKLIENDKKLSKLSKAELKTLLESARQELESSNFELDDLSRKLNELLAQTGQKPAVLFSLIRIATTQAPASPALAETLAALGKEKVLKRIEKQLTTL